MSTSGTTGKWNPGVIVGRRLDRMFADFYAMDPAAPGWAAMEEAIDRRQARWGMACEFSAAKGLAAYDPEVIGEDPRPILLGTGIEAQELGVDLVVPMGPQERVRVRVWVEEDESLPAPMEVERWTVRPARREEVAQAIAVLHRARDLAEFSLGMCVGPSAEARRGPAGGLRAARRCRCGLCESRAANDERRRIGADEEESE